MTEPGALPVYMQISEMLLREIAAGHFLDGERFAPEREMAREYGVSVGTLRKALAELERQGMLERRQGSGNYVRAGKSVDGVYAFFRLELPGGGGLPTASVLDIGRDVPPGAVFAQAHRIRRLRYLSGTAVALEEIWLDGSMTDSINAAELSQSLYLYYKNALGFWISKAEDRVGLDRVPDWATDACGMEKGAPCAHVERLSWAQGSAPVEYSRTWFNADRARYVSRLK